MKRGSRVSGIGSGRRSVTIAVSAVIAMMLAIISPVHATAAPDPSSSGFRPASVTSPDRPMSRAGVAADSGFPGAFAALAPSRLLDTRSSVGAAGPVAAGGVIDVQITGRAGVPASGVAAVALNVTAVAPSAAGYITAWPSTGGQPNASNLNFVAGQTIPNFVVVPVGSNGRIKLFNGSPGTVQLLADVAGYYLAGTPAGPGAFAALAPSRLLDTRSSVGAAGPVAAGGVIDVQITGRAGVPASGVAAVALNVTAVAPSAAGYITAWPSTGGQPNASNLNFVAGQTIPNFVVVPVGSNGRIKLFNGSPGTVQLLADVAGYYLADTPVRISMLSPGGGSPGGGTTVTVTGSGFTGATSVTFDGMPASSVHVLSDTVLTAVSPAGDGVVDVVVNSPKGTSSGPAGRYTYAPRALSVFAGVPFSSGSATSTALGSPVDVAVDASGNLFIADPYYSIIEKVSPGGTLSVVAGTGVSGTPVPGPAVRSPLPRSSSTIAVDGSGNLYIGAPSYVLKVDTAGQLSVYATGLGYKPDLGTDAAGNLYVSNGSNIITRVTPSGAVSTINLGFDDVASMAVASNGDLFFFSGGRIKKRTVAGQISVVAGTGSAGAPVAGPATASPLYESILAVDASQNVYARSSGFWGSRIVKVAGGELSIVAGAAALAPPIPGPASSSPFTFISSLAVNSAGTTLFAADSGRGSRGDDDADPAQSASQGPRVVTKIAGGTLSIVAGADRGTPQTGPSTSGPMSRPVAVATDSNGNTYILDENEHVVRKVDTAGSMSVIAGNGLADEPTPGPALNRSLGDPLRAITADNAGNVYVASAYRVLKISSSGQLSFFAGTGEWGSPLPGTATLSPLDGAYGVATAASGGVFISTDSRIVRVDSEGQLALAAGSGAHGAPVPGAAVNSPLRGPRHVATDAAGSVFFADFRWDEDNGQSVDPHVLKLSTSGQLSVIAGSGAEGAPTPGPAPQTALSFPTGVAVDGSGNVYVSVRDGRTANTNLVLKINPAGNLSIVAGTGSPGFTVAGPATGTSLRTPVGLAVDAGGALYIADSTNRIVLRVR